jgi:hypothetical protein
VAIVTKIIKIEERKEVVPENSRTRRKRKDFIDSKKHHQKGENYEVIG